MDEEWRPVKGYEGRYWVSNLGRVKSTRKIMRLASQGKYLQVQFGRRGWQPLVHRLVAEAFIPNPENKPEVNHIDGNKHNNSITNLEWVTRCENMIHSCHTLGHKGTPPHYKGDKNPSAKLTQEQADMIRKRLSAGESNKTLATEYGISLVSLWKLKTGQTYSTA